MPRPLVPDRRRRILTAARQLILDQGWPHTTVTDIAARAGIGKGAVYLEFADKTDILDSVLREGTRRLTANVRERIISAPGTIGLAEVYRCSVEALLDDPLMSGLYLGAEAVLGDHVRTVTDDRYHERFAWLADYAARLQDAGVIDGSVEVGGAVRMLSVFTIGLVNAAGTLGTTSPEQLSATVGIFAELVGRGLASDRPIDPEAARAAHLALLDRLDRQLTELDGTS